MFRKIEEENKLLDTEEEEEAQRILREEVEPSVEVHRKTPHPKSATVERGGSSPIVSVKYISTLKNHCHK